jgi:hypothetical protein
VVPPSTASQGFGLQRLRDLDVTPKGLQPFISSLTLTSRLCTKTAKSPRPGHRCRALPPRHSWDYRRSDSRRRAAGHHHRQELARARLQSRKDLGPAPTRCNGGAFGAKALHRASSVVEAWTGVPCPSENFAVGGKRGARQKEGFLPFLFPLCFDPHTLDLCLFLFRLPLLGGILMGFAFSGIRTSDHQAERSRRGP